MIRKERVCMAELTALPVGTRLILRGRAGALEAAAGVLGFDLPPTCRAVIQGARTALWLGPDEFLLLAAAGEPLADGLGQALHGHPHALVDVSHRQCALELRGAEAADMLNAGCPLDLHMVSFPVGMCTRTVLAKAEVILWRTEPDAFRIEMMRSFAPYVRAFLEEAALA
jgi:sarcosine oxidase, subunit gamma